mmetsp:Transcript_45942/g.99809  ORF Transcript_45942/g.99809 Transcript_45942/m.99809 type:complete len:197 (+) Transcript_45942:69-659(+)|eukprot:CAMPEP_0170572336 /NCGR_PEP_ID=MMETSP0224-20130122/2161_1 /TAXON_ID=285029 /ORGANISM="Togula jolla, Strain CCCM 725" /LENGTH=196 /DNA_ID=CAMNT_0010894817 /DNA_START=66 /DNA_END=656 /DNA_ORIENTATION=+
MLLLRNLALGAKSPIVTRRAFSSPASSDAVRNYARTLCLWHWTMGGALFGTIGTVKVAQQLDSKNPAKGDLMNLHKSLALVCTGLLIPRVALRLMTSQKAPAAWHSKASHLVLYGFMTYLPVTGIAMGYYSGKGIPFFDLYHIPGADESSKDGKFAGFMVKVHRIAGQLFIAWTCLHMGVAIGGGRDLLVRISPVH